MIRSDFFPCNEVNGVFDFTNRPVCAFCLCWGIKSLTDLLFLLTVAKLPLDNRCPFFCLPIWFTTDTMENVLKSHQRNPFMGNQLFQKMHIQRQISFHWNDPKPADIWWTWGLQGLRGPQLQSVIHLWRTHTSWEWILTHRFGFKHQQLSPARRFTPTFSARLTWCLLYCHLKLGFEP